MPQRRIEISPDDPGFPQRFALRVRERMRAKGWTSRDVAERVTAAGLEIGPRGVDCWLRGANLPKLKDIEAVAAGLGFADYRKLLPEPLKQRK